MTEQPTRRTIDLSVEVDGTPEQVWTAIATGPGISSWFVPTTVEEQEGGRTTSIFGPGPDMTMPGRVVAWEPPHRVLFDGGEDVEGLAFEWLVETRDGGSCVVRLVNSGFGSGGEWDAQYDGMEQGWRLFLKNLQLHLAHFRGQAGRAMLPTGDVGGRPGHRLDGGHRRLGHSRRARPGGAHRCPGRRSAARRHGRGLRAGLPDEPAARGAAARNRADRVRGDR